MAKSPLAKCERFSAALSQLSDVLLAVSSVGTQKVIDDNILTEEFDKLILLMSQATQTVKTVVEFIQTISTSPHSKKFEHFVETPRNVSKRRKKKNRASEGSSFENSLQLEPLDEAGIGQLNHLNLEAELSSDLDIVGDRSAEKVNQIDEPLATVETEQLSLCLNTDMFDSPRTPNISSGCDRNQEICDLNRKCSPLHENDLFSEPLSPIINLHPSQPFSPSQLEQEKIGRTAVNSTLNSSSVGSGRSSNKFLEVNQENRKSPTVRVNFGDAVYFYFARCQGWNSVSREGGNTLGMTDKHFHQQKFTLRESPDPDSILQELSKNTSHSFTESNQQVIESRSSSWDPLQNTERNKMSYLTAPHSEESGLESDSSLNTSKKGELGTRGLHRISARKRRTLLKSCDISLDHREAEELRRLRESRETVGCQCYGGRCDSADCQCAHSAIQCHQETDEGPCSCSQSLCNNPEGRYQFDETKVKMHYVETLMGERLNIN